jgi:3-phenylpropionate/trans-cinnamate dioxygenase ferredoxin reductase component
VTGPIAIVGAGLAGLRAAETLRREGYDGKLTVIGEEAHEPYDRPPLSKQVLTGWVASDRTTLPRLADLDDVDWQLGRRAVGLDLAGKKIVLEDGGEVPYARCLIATGVRARQWPNETEAALDGVFVVHTADDSHGLRERLAAGPRRVLVIGGGFTGSEVASVCRMLDIEVTLVELADAPLSGALGGVIGAVAAAMQRDAGVDLRTATRVDAIEGDDRGRVSGVRLSDGTHLDVDVVVVALGGIRNTEWLRGSRLAASPLGIGCDAGCRAFDGNAIVTDDVFVAGDVARFPHPLYGYQMVTLEHWRNALIQAEIAAHNMIAEEADRRPHVSVPWFWSIQFEVNIKSVGVPSIADQVVVTQGSTDDRRFVAAYGLNGQIVAAVSFNAGRYLEFYERLIAEAAPFPPNLSNVDQATGDDPVPADFPPASALTNRPTVVLTGHSPTEMRVERKEIEESAA